MKRISFILDPSEVQYTILQKVFSQAFQFRKEYHESRFEAISSDEPFDREEFIREAKEDTKERFGTRVNVAIFDVEAEMLDLGYAKVAGRHAAFSEKMGIQINSDSVWLPYFRIVRSAAEIPGEAQSGRVRWLVIREDEGAMWADAYLEDD